MRTSSIVQRQPNGAYRTNGEGSLYDSVEYGRRRTGPLSSRDGIQVKAGWEARPQVRVEAAQGDWQNFDEAMARADERHENVKGRDPGSPAGRQASAVNELLRNSERIDGTFTPRRLREGGGPFVKGRPDRIQYERDGQRVVARATTDESMAIDFQIIQGNLRRAHEQLERLPRE